MALPQPVPAEFLALFPGHRIQYFDDTPARDPARASWSDRLDPVEAARKQVRGCGVYFSPNAFDGPRTIEHLRHVQALFLDIDCAKEGDGAPRAAIEAAKGKTLAELESFRLRPHAVIGTKNGLQAIWRLQPVPPVEGKALFDEAEALLIDRFHADPAAKDVTRVLRVPGYDHLKNPHEPFRCSLLLNDTGREPFSLAEFVTTLRAMAVFAGTGPPRASTPPRERPKKWESVLGGVAQGGRNDAAASLTGHFLRQLPESAWEGRGWDQLCAWNGRNTPPLPERELRAVFQSVARREERRRVQAGRRESETVSAARRSQADRLVDLVTDDNCALFLDQVATPFASILVGGHRETWPVRSRRMRIWLSSLLWQAERQAPGQSALAAALTLLEARACFGGRRLPLANRVASREGALWYDLGNDRFEAVRVTADGWDIVPAPPALFYRYAHQGAQVRPARGGDVRAVLPFLNLSHDVPDVLVLTYLVSCFLPDIQHPVPLLYGPHGSAKSTCSWFLRRLIDPSVLQALALPSTVPDLVQQLSHHWFAFFDNVSELPDWASDVLCRAVTGEGFSKRELYSDDEDVIYAFRRCVGINGVNLAARKPDLLDRSILLRLERIPAERRQPLRVLWEQFEAARPGILGGIFDALSASLRPGTDVRLSEPPRMADFAEQGSAIAQALGYGARAFLDAYLANIGDQRQEAVQASAVATAVAALMERRPRWEGSASELLSALEAVAGREKINTKARSWPASASVLTRRLNEVKTMLADVGLFVAVGKASGGRRVIVVERTTGQDAPTAPGPDPGHAPCRAPDGGNTGPPATPPPRPARLPDQAEQAGDGGGGVSGP